MDIQQVFDLYDWCSKCNALTLSGQLHKNKSEEFVMYYTCCNRPICKEAISAYEKLYSYNNMTSKEEKEESEKIETEKTKSGVKRITEDGSEILTLEEYIRRKNNKK